jgi:hypothetical protein
MAIVFACTCGKQFQVGDEYAGKTARCPNCKQTVTVPAAGSNTAKPPADGTDKSPAGPKKPISRKAIAALVLGAASFLGSCLFGIPAAAVGVWSLMDIRKRGIGGQKLAFIGIALGLIGCICNLPFGVLGVVKGINMYRESSATGDNEKNLKTIGEALKKYADDKQDQGFPPGAIYQPNGQAMLSWRVELLLYLEDSKLYREFKLDEPWDSATNKPLIEKMPKVFAGPNEDENKKGLTHYRVFHKPYDGGTSPSPVFVVGKKLQLKDIKEPASTILVVEAAEAVPWTRPEEILFPVSGPLENRLFGSSKKYCTLLFADGSVRTIKYGDMSQGDLEGAIAVKPGH